LYPKTRVFPKNSRLLLILPKNCHLFPGMGTRLSGSTGENRINRPQIYVLPKKNTRAKILFIIIFDKKTIIIILFKFCQIRFLEKFHQIYRLLTGLGGGLARYCRQRTVDSTAFATCPCCMDHALPPLLWAVYPLMANVAWELVLYC